MPSLKPKLEVNVGGMFSGKSTELLRQGQRHSLAGHKVIFVKPAMDNRYSDEEIVTHDGKKVNSLTIYSDGRILPFSQWKQLADADVILIDEIQFFDYEFVTDIEYFLEEGKVVYCSGLDMDYQGKPFSITAYLMAVADKVNKFHAVCADCGDEGYVTAKTSDSKYRIELGSQDIYKPVCRKCYKKLEEENHG